MNIIQTWKTIDELLLLKNDDQALVFILSTLTDNLSNIEDCNEFINYSMDKNMNADVIVHILFTIVPIKEKLSNWNTFLSHCEKLLLSLVGEDETKILLKSLDIKMSDEDIKLMNILMKTNL